GTSPGMTATPMSRAGILCLGHPPEERQRALDDAAHVAAPRLVAVVEAGRHVDDLLHRRLVEAPDHGLFLVEVLGGEPGGNLLLDVSAVRPAEPRLVAVGANGDVARRGGAVGARMPRVEHAPAALVRRVLGRATLADGA